MWWEVGVTLPSKLKKREVEKRRGREWDENRRKVNGKVRMLKYANTHTRAYTHARALFIKCEYE